MKFVALTVVLVSCGGATMPLPVHPKPSVATCSGPIFVGERLAASLEWECDVGQSGRVGWSDHGECQHAVEARAACEGTPCEVEVFTERNEGYTGGRSFRILATTVGRLSVMADLQHQSGPHDRYVAMACDVMPVPDVAITCTVRDPSTGSFTPCSASVSLGSEVHIAFKASRPDGGALPWPSIQFDGDAPSRYTGKARAEVTCASGPAESNTTIDRRCSSSPTPGEHVVRVQFRDLPPTIFSYEVGAVHAQSL